FDLQLLMPSTLRVENNLARMVASADLTLRGTYDRPVIAGHADIERGEVTFEGRRYRITRGTMDFTNPARIEPFFDVEAETNVRVPGQTYRVTVAFAGTSEQLRPTLNSDPPLPTSDVLALLFSDVRRTGTQDVAPELRAGIPRETRVLMRSRLVQCCAALLVLAVLGIGTPVSADVASYIGRPIGSVNLMLEGRDTTDPLLLQVVSTVAGEPLSMIEV